jgi:hypothetical protein
MTGDARSSDHLEWEAARQSAARRSLNWPRRALSGRVYALIWALRIYVVGMLAVVAMQVARLI